MELTNKKLAPIWNLPDPFEQLPKFPIQTVEVFGETVHCDGCGREDAVGCFYIKAERHIDLICNYCLVRQCRVSATRDSLIRVVGVAYPIREMLFKKEKK